MTTSYPRHGGDLAFARLHYPGATDGWLDLSTGINPVGYPAPPVTAEMLARLPDRVALERLIATARQAYAIADGASLLAAPGTEIAIHLLPLLLPPGEAAIISPTYGSHAEAWRQAGRAAAAIGDLDAVSDDTKFVVVANPNNPDGRVSDPVAAAKLARRLADRSGLLIVDEAFADVMPSASLAPHLADAPAMVLRSFGKFFGLAGLRLGFVAGPASVLNRLEQALGAWPVSAAAIAIADAALGDRTWQDETRRRLSRDARAFTERLQRHGLRVGGATDLFILVETAIARDIHHGLARQGVWTRSFSDRRDWLRFGIPPAAELERVDRALGEVLASISGKPNPTSDREAAVAAEPNTSETW